MIPFRSIVAIAVLAATMLSLRGFAQCGESWEVVASGSPGSVAICYDEVRRETITQSGGKLWAWDGSRWTMRWEEPALDGADAMAFDRNRGVVYIFGGAGYDDKLWRWDGSALALIANDTIGGRAYAAVAFDWKRDRLVVHGGYNGSFLLADTQEWDPGTGTWRGFGDGPIGRRYAHKMVYDPVRERCVLHGGYYFFNRNDTWTWDGGSWSLVTQSGPARYVANMAWDATRQQVVLHGGTTCCGEVEYSSTWTWRGGAWSECALQGPPRGYTNMAFDLHRDRFVMPGGIGPTPSGRQWIPETNELAMGCAGDIDGDGRVAGSDLGKVLIAWGAGAGAAEDINRDGIVDGVDLSLLLAAWGSCS
jgi:hypothetical protein